MAVLENPAGSGALTLSIQSHTQTEETGPYIAIIDDLDINRAFFARVAQTIPTIQRVNCFSSALEALEHFDKDPPDLIITDFSMPHMDATAFLEELRLREELQDVPVIVVTSHAKLENRHQALLKGATDFLTTPFDTFEFQMRARNLLRLSLHQKLLKSHSSSLHKKLVEARLKSLRSFKQTREHFTTIIDCIPALVFVVNKAGECVFANQYCSEVLEDNWQRIDSLAAMMPQIDLQSGMCVSQEITVRGKDQQQRSFILIAKAIPGDRGNDHFVVYSGIEITGLKETEESLRNAKREAESANRAKSAFLANMSHEMRTPLNAIIGFSDIMQEEMFGPIGNPRYREYILDIQRSAKHLLFVINEILDFSQIEARRYKPVITTFSLRDCLKGVRRLLETEIKTQGNQLVIKIVTDFRLRTDCQKLSQVLMNVLTNANKFTQAGYIFVSAARNRLDELVITVEDTGIGMSEEELALALTEFGRVEDSALVRTEKTGTGLGLPISIGFMKLLGGKLEIDSRKGIGTKVNLILPKEAVIAEYTDKAPAK